MWRRKGGLGKRWRQGKGEGEAGYEEKWAKAYWYWRRGMTTEMVQLKTRHWHWGSGPQLLEQVRRDKGGLEGGKRRLELEQAA